MPTNPLTGEEEDTDVGFPGPDTTSPSASVPMKVAMGTLAVLAVIAGALQIPGVDDVVTRFLEPTFADSKFANVDVATGSAWIGLIIGAADRRRSGSRSPTAIWVAKPGTASRIRERVPALHNFLVHKWYFDELIDFLVVRPTLWAGRFINSVLERVVIGGAVTGGTTGLVRAGSAAVRRAQTGFLRYYAAVMVICISGVALYFLISST